MKAAIRQRARELGFDDCRFAEAKPPGDAIRFDAWLAAGHHGEMGWIERSRLKRLDPAQVLPGARTIVAVAASYASAGDGQGPCGTPSPDAQAHGPRGLVARYARFADYHRVKGERLEQLARFVDEIAHAPSRSLWYVDTGPILERSVAQSSGLGFIGKHTNLISRRFGNWILLGEILTTVDLEPDEPEPNRCGNCVRCIEACPTRAILAPFQLDARRCISYLTIELKGAIPPEFRPAIGNRIFGCDDCLAVCPWNRFAREGEMMRAQAHSDLAEPDLLELLALDEAGFRRRFDGTPILRSKRRGLLRNVCVALGNTGGSSALPALKRAAADPEPLIAEHARWAIDRLTGGRPEAVGDQSSLSFTVDR